MRCRLAGLRFRNQALFEVRGLGRWAFIEIADPWDARNTLSTYIRKRETNG